jgi:tellurite resistance protein TehA-like permease
MFPMPVDSSSKVVIQECNQNAWQQWIFTDDGLLTLANNTSSFPEAPLLLLTITETCFFFNKTYALTFLIPVLLMVYRYKHTLAPEA